MGCIKPEEGGLHQTLARRDHFGLHFPDETDAQRSEMTCQRPPAGLVRGVTEGQAGWGGPGARKRGVGIRGG